MRQGAAVPAIQLPFRHAAVGLFNQVHDSNGSGASDIVEQIHQLSVFWCRIDVDNLPESRSLDRRRLRIEAGEVKLAQIGGDMRKPAIAVEGPQRIPMIQCEVFLMAV